MKTNNIKVLCVLAFLGGASVASAQVDTSKSKNLNREMTLEREYDPSVQDASKVNTLPEIKEPEVRKIPIDYATFTTPTDPKKEIGLLPSGNVMTQMNYNKRRGYLNLGVGSPMNLNGDLGYHLLSTSTDLLNVWFSHRSAHGKVKYIQEELDDVKVKAKLNDNLGGLDFRHHFNKLTLNMGAKFGYSTFNYYGATEQLLGNTDWEALVSEYESQANQTIQAHMGVESKEDAHIGYLLDLGVTNFSHKKGLDINDKMMENTFEAKFDMNAGFNGNMRVGVGGLAEYFHYGDLANEGNLNAKASSGYAGYHFENHAEIMLSPYFKVDGDSWKLKLGANVMMETGENKFMASPNIAADFDLGSKTELYLNAGGKMYSNSLYETSRINRYFIQSDELLPSRNWIDAVIGLRSGVAPGFWFDLFAGYKITDDDVFFVPTYRHNQLGALYGALQFDSKHGFGGASLKYNYQQLFEIRLKGVYNSWKVESDNSDVPVEAYGKPELEISAGVTVKPINKLAVDVDYYLATGRQALVEKTLVEMKNINELNVTGTYSLNDTFGFYVKLQNVLCQKYEMYYGYPLQNFSGMVGVNINF